jgi:hypothetical protein
MKRWYSLFSLMFLFNLGLSQVEDLNGTSILAVDANKTLRAATSMCAVSLLYQAVGGGLILTGMDMESDTETGLLSIGLFAGIGGVGMQTNNAILTNQAYRQIKLLTFAPEDSELRKRMLRNIKSARTLAIIQNITPIVAAAAGAISYSAHKSKYQEYDEAFFESPSFWIPSVSICFIGAVLTIPIIVLIEKTRSDLESFQRKLSLGATKYGVGVTYNF